MEMAELITCGNMKESNWNNLLRYNSKRFRHFVCSILPSNFFPFFQYYWLNDLSLQTLKIDKQYIRKYILIFGTYYLKLYVKVVD